MSETGCCIVYVTVGNEEEGRRVASALVESKLVACANMIGPIRSLYWWEGKVQDDPEMLLMMKTRDELFDRVEAKVKEVHSYEVPEIIAAPIEAGHAPYLDWIEETTGKNE